MWRTSSAIFIAIIFSGGLGCSKRASAPPESVASPTAEQAELSFEAQLSQVLRGEVIAIRLTQSKITGDQLGKLGAVRDNLLELQLDAGVIEDTSLESLTKLTALEHLRMRDSPITDAGIVKLDPNQLPNLRIVNLPQSNLTAAGLAHLARFPKLVQLRLSAAQLEDRAAEVLATFPMLGSLHLIGPKFTDAALDHLAKAPKLSSLYIDDCHLSDAVWERLFKEKPNIHVHIDQHHHDRDPNADH